MQIEQRLTAAQKVTNAVADQGPIEGFADEIGGARLVSGFYRCHVVQAGDHDNGQRHIGPLTHRHTHLKPRHFGHADIQHDQIKGLAGE